MLWAQSTMTLIGQSQECIEVHFDKSFYVAGETVWFKAYLSAESGDVRSKILHIDLVDHLNQNIATLKLPINEKSSFASIPLPMDAYEGHYRFRAYTHYNMNFEPALVYETLLPVYQLSKDHQLPADSINSIPKQRLENSGISLAFDKSVYQTRDTMRVSIQLLNSNDTQGALDAPGRGNLSVAVIPLELAGLEVKTNPNTPCTRGKLKNEQPVPPQRTLYLEGKLRDPITKTDAEPKLITVFMDKSSRLIKAYADKGNIRIPVYDYWGTGVFQIMNLDPYNTTEFEFIANSEVKFSTPYYNTELPVRTPVILEYMDQLEKRRKIIELFELNDLGEIKYSQPPEMTADAVYHTEDYRDIYSFEEFINEAIGNVKVGAINGIKTIRLFNRELGDPFPQHPWYIVDGFTTYNEKEVLDIQYKDVVEVRLYSKTSTVQEYFKDFTWNSGVVEIITRDVKYRRNLRNHPNVVQMEGFTTTQNFSSTLKLPQNRTTPDLRGVLYWAPNVLTNDQGNGQLIIPLSDDSGEFAVVVKGRNGWGQFITGFSTFEIKTKLD
ncbi:MAG: hypothetical protein OER04_07735 [Cyclobacteriaceae bacterium]|nr:hypothetical protein [Cyclobacteriaceae bacterium]